MFGTVRSAFEANPRLTILYVRPSPSRRLWLEVQDLSGIGDPPYLCHMLHATYNVDKESQKRPAIQRTSLPSAVK